MNSGISVQAKQELVRAVAKKFRCADRQGKRTILDYFVAGTGYHRKHSIQVAQFHRRAGRTAKESTIPDL